MKRGGGAQGPGCCPRLARPLAELCGPPEPGRQVRGAGHAARGEGPRAVRGRQQGRAPGEESRAEPPPPPPPDPSLRGAPCQEAAARPSPGQAGQGEPSTATSPARGQRKRTRRKGGLTKDPAMALDFLAGCAGGKEAGGSCPGACGGRERRASGARRPGWEASAPASSRPSDLPWGWGFLVCKMG